VAFPLFLPQGEGWREGDFSGAYHFIGKGLQTVMLS
jgi:hypothetical protein